MSSSLCTGLRFVLCVCDDLCISKMNFDYCYYFVIEFHSLGINLVVFVFENLAFDYEFDISCINFGSL